jgi:hypothetical protein
VFRTVGVEIRASSWASEDQLSHSGKLAFRETLISTHHSHERPGPDGLVTPPSKKSPSDRK